MRISVVMPAYNAEDYIAEAIESALGQSEPPHEILIVDDQSADRTREIVARYPVRLLVAGENVGHAAARNRGIAAASGDIVAALDADDVWLPNHLQTIRELFERHPSAIVAASGVRVFGIREHDLLPRLEAGAPRQALERAFEDCLLWHSATAVRTDALRAAEGYSVDDAACPDMDLWMRLARVGPFVVTHEITARYRAHETQISHHPYRQEIAEFWHRRRLIDRIRADGDAALGDRLASRMQELWREHAADAWRCRDAVRLRAIAGLQPMIERTTASDAWTMRATALCIPLVRQTRDRVPASARHRVRDLLRRVRPGSATG